MAIIATVMTPSSSSSYTLLPVSKPNHSLLIKLLVSFLLSGLAFRLFLSSYPIAISRKTQPPPNSGETEPLFKSPQELPVQSFVNSNINFGRNAQAPLKETVEDFLPTSNLTSHKNVSQKCDIFSGSWVRDLAEPRYTNETCRFIEPPQNCQRNGRPDSDFLYWRWKPRDCELPRFSAAKFLNLMRSKSWAFIGDSISRNHVQSLLCILSQVEEPKEVYHDEEFRSKRWHFPAHNFTLSVVWSPYLVKADVFEDNDGHASSETQLYLDKIDPNWSKQYTNFDYVIISGGKWYLKTGIYYENSTIIGCHYCPKRNLTDLGYHFAYRKVIRLVLNFMTQSSHKPFILFRTTTPDHFENGEWFSGGTCNRTVPFHNGEVTFKEVDSIMTKIELEEYESIESSALHNGVNLKLFDAAKPSLLRPDGHPGPYRNFQPFAIPQKQDEKLIRDCLHWCLPGPIDSWSDMLMHVLGH